MTRTFNDLGPLQRKFMLRAYNEGVGVDDPLATAKRTQRLETAGLIEKRESKKGRVSWRTTDLGSSMVRKDTNRFLHRRGFPSYTTQAHEAMFGEPEVMGDAA